MFEITTLLSSPIALLIGKFDGVHLGHRHRIDRARALATLSGAVVLITFSNHPCEYFNPTFMETKITSQSEKEALLRAAGVDLILTLPFDASIATLSAATFLTRVKEHLPFDHLILGVGETIGCNRSGTPDELKPLQKTLNFHLHYEDKIKKGPHTISSTLIRKLIAAGSHDLAGELLGHPTTNPKTLYKSTP